MNLKEFMTSAIAESVSVGDKKLSYCELNRRAGRIFRANYVAPKHTLIRFDTSFVKHDNLRYYHFNLLLRIMPNHPYFRTYLKASAIRQTCHLCLFQSPFENEEFSYCQHGADTELDAIVDDTEKHIIDRVMQFENCVHMVSEIAVLHGLAYESMSSLMEAMDYLLKHSLYDRNYLLNAENRNELLRVKS